MKNFFRVVERYKAITLCCCTLGCADVSYTQRAENGTSFDIDDVSVSYSGKVSRFGVLPSGVTKTKMFMQTPIGDSAVVSWTQFNGESVESQVDLSGIPKDHGKIVVTFVIDSDTSASVGYYLEQ